MKLYLMQHGKAMSKAEDPERPLTAEGKEDVTGVAQLLSRMDVQISEIRHSGKRRAEDTATIVAQSLHLQEKVNAVDGLKPNDDVFPIAEALKIQTDALMLVGHLPFLNRLASVLLAGDPETSIIQFQMGGVVCLTRPENQWMVAWMLVPEMVR